MRRSYKRSLQYSRRGSGSTSRYRKSVRAFGVLQARNRGGSFNRILSAGRARASAEVKVVDTIVGSAGGVIIPINTANNNIQYCNLIASGAGFNNRVGRRIEMQSLHLTGFIKQTSNTTTVHDYARIVVVYDRQPNGASTVFNNVFLDYDAISGSATTSLSGVNPDERERFVICADIRLQLPANINTNGTSGSTDGANTSFEINRFIKFKNLQTHYKSDSSPPVIGDVATGALFVITQGSLGSGSEGWEAVLKWRLRYKDT